MSLDIEKERYGFERCAKRLGKCSFGRFFDGSYKDARTAELFAVWLSAKNDCETFYRRNAELETENAILRATQPAPIPAQTGTGEESAGREGGPKAAQESVETRMDTSFQGGPKPGANMAEPPAGNALTDEAKDAALLTTLHAVRAWFESQHKVISKGGGSSWDMLQCREQMDIIDAAIASHIKAGRAGKDGA
jgi:hypothetical protein